MAHALVVHEAAVAGIGEPDGAVAGVHDGIVRGVQFAAFALVREHRHGTAVLVTHHAPVAVLADDEASLAVETATGSPASFVLAGSGAYLKMGGLAGLWPYPYGTQNVSGTADAGSLMVNVSGLPVKHCRHLGDTEIVVSNSQTAKWREISPMVVTAENVALAGRDVGIFGMGILTPFVPSGIVEILPVAP